MGGDWPAVKRESDVRSSEIEIDEKAKRSRTQRRRMEEWKEKLTIFGVFVSVK